MSVLRLEELSTPALDDLDRARTALILTVSPVAERLVAERRDWSVVLAPTLYLGSFTFDAVGTETVRQRALRDVVVDYGTALARAGFRDILFFRTNFWPAVGAVAVLAAVAGGWALR